MSDLDQKLEKYVLNVYAAALLNDSISPMAYKVVYTDIPLSQEERDELTKSTKGFVDEIKRSFMDAGWSPPTVVKAPQEFVQFVAEKVFKEFNYGQPVLTGKEWYDRLIHELEVFNYEHRGGSDIYVSEQFIEVAKRAAGIK